MQGMNSVKFCLLDFILIMLPKEEITLRSSILCFFRRLLVILALLIMLIALCYITLHFEFSGPVCLPRSDRNHMASSQQASVRVDSAMASTNCCNFQTVVTSSPLRTESRIFALPSPPRHSPSSYFLHDLWHGLFFNSFYLLRIFYDCRPLSHSG